MKTRKHHNNKGERKVRRGKTRRDIECISKKLRIPLAKRGAGEMK